MLFVSPKILCQTKKFHTKKRGGKEKCLKIFVICTPNGPKPIVGAVVVVVVAVFCFIN